MRPHGRAQIDPRHPRALAVCDRCGGLVNHDTLQWQFRWRGPRLQNIRLLVCPPCYDTPNEQERTFVLPPDPVPIANPRPKNYVVADNPVSPIGFNPINNFRPTSSLGANIGTLTQNGGLDAPFNFSPGRTWGMSAALAISSTGLQNTIGKAWNGDPTGVSLTMPSTAPLVLNIASSFTAYAPSDQAFLRSGPADWVFQGSNDGKGWTTLSSGTTAGTVGEILSVAVPTGAAYAYHQLALAGDGISHIGVAALQISVANAAQNEI
jgi:hypothetical protein